MALYSVLREFFVRLIVLLAGVALTTAAAHATPINDATYDTIIGSCISRMDTGPAQNAPAGLKYEVCKCSAGEVRSTISMEDAKTLFESGKIADDSASPLAIIVKDCVRKNVTKG